MQKIHSHQLNNLTNFANWYIVRQLIDKEERTQLEAQISALDWEQSETVGKAGPEMRESQVKWTGDCDESPWKWIYKRTWKWANIANDDNWDFHIKGWKDSMQYTSYSFPDGHYDWHTDIGAPTIDHRKISSSILLKKPEAGGEFVFHGALENIVVDLDEGDAVFFPSWMVHRVNKVLSGERRSLVSWISGPTFK